MFHHIIRVFQNMSGGSVYRVIVSIPTQLWLQAVTRSATAAETTSAAAATAVRIASDRAFVFSRFQL
jgi:hypothetical protein